MRRIRPVQCASVGLRWSTAQGACFRCFLGGYVEGIDSGRWIACLVAAESGDTRRVVSFGLVQRGNGSSYGEHGTQSMRAE